MRVCMFQGIGIRCALDSEIASTLNHLDTEDEKQFETLDDCSQMYPRLDISSLGLSLNHSLGRNDGNHCREKHPIKLFMFMSL